MRSRGQDYDDAQAAYLEAKANVESARLNLEYTTIRSPVDGKTGPMLIQPGNMVSSTSSSTSNSTTAGISTANPLVTINQIQPIKSFLRPAPVRPAAHPGAQMARPGGLTIALNMRDRAATTLRRRSISSATPWQASPAQSNCAPASPMTDMTLVSGQLVDVTVVLSQ